MKDPRRSRVLCLASLVGVLAAGCASVERPVVQQPTVKAPTAQQPTVEQHTYLAQSAVVNCLPRDPSMVCCIKKFPLTPMESCGATAMEVAEVLNGTRVLNEAAQTLDEDSSEKAEEDDDAHNAHLPEWKQECIRGYKNCQEFGWTGNCHDCLRYCEGQHAWPTATCGPPKRRSR